MINERNKYLLSQQLTGEISDLEKEELEKILDEDAELAAFTEAFDAHNRQINVRKRIDEYRKQQAFKKKWLKLSLGGLGIAASVALVYFFIIIPNKPKEVIIQGNQAVAFRIFANKDSLTVIYRGKPQMTQAVDKTIDINALHNPVYASHIADSIETEIKKIPTIILNPNIASIKKESANQEIKNPSPPITKNPKNIIKSAKKDEIVTEEQIKSQRDNIAYTENAEKNYDPLNTNTADYSDTNTKGTGSQAVDNFNQAIEAFKKQEYDKTVFLLPRKSVEGKTPEKRLLAHAYFKLKKYSDAKSLFKEIVDSGFGDSNDEWSLLMTYLAQYPSKKSEFDTLIEKIKNNKDSEYSKKAEDLLKQMPKRN